MPADHPALFQQPWPEGEYRFFQLGFVVDDLVAVARRWAEVFAVGPFHVLPGREVDCTYRGAPSAIELQVAVAQAGPAQIELIHQGDDRPSVFTELARTGASGFHQICTVTADYHRTLEHYRALGYEVGCEIPGRGGAPAVSYVDTLADFGFFTEVVQGTELFLGQLATVADACASWDGRDPVRRLTRDGYVAL